MLLLLIVMCLGIAVLGFLFGHGVGHSAGYALAMKENGWSRVFNGWYKETE